MTEHSAADPPAGDTPGATIDVSYVERTVLIAVQPPAEGAEPPTLDDVVHVLASSPLGNVDKIAAARALRDPGGVPVMVGEVAPPRGLEENWFIATSSNRLAAYLVPNATPVTDDPDAPMAPVSVSAIAIRKQLAEEGITHGVLTDVVGGFEGQAALTSIVQVAQGEAAVEGRDGRIERVEELLAATDSHEPVTREDGSVDHHATVAPKFVDEGTLIAKHYEPIEGRDGEDILGNPRPAKAVRDETLDSLAGENTEVRGSELVATSPGRPVVRGSRIDVLPVFAVEGDLDYSVGNIDFAGDVTVRGDVMPGFSIHATGSVTVYGMTEHATIHAGGDLILQGVVGLIEADDHGDGMEHEAEIVVGGNLTAQYLHNIAVEVAGEAIVNREMVNCQIVADRVELPSKGRIVGGVTAAKLEIECGTLGSNNGVSTHMQLHAKRSEGPAVLRGLAAVHAGVKINVTGALLEVEDDLPSGSFWQLEGEVVRMDALASVQDLVALAEATDRRPPQLPDEQAGEPDTTADATEAAA